MSGAALNEIATGLTVALEGLRRLESGEDWVDQHNSPLGRRAHLAAVKAGRVPGFKPEGTRLVLVRRRDLDAYIEARPMRARAPDVTPAETVAPPPDEQAAMAAIIARATRHNEARRTKKGRSA